ncbi:hypothetical protein AB0F77_37975 [Streptomyces sp. NPDC026672]|uniref:hypothetical protein n=1 Tax=unclassified Streptomyces TaxID=2593676 RepID=UPI0034092FDE
MVEFDSAAGAVRLDKLLRRAVEQVPYYRGLSPDVRHGLNDFPLVHKAQLRDCFTDFIARTGDGRMERGTYFMNQTSGSTGQPVRVLSTAESTGVTNAVVQERINVFRDVPASGVVLHVGLMYAGMKQMEAISLPRPYVKINLPGFDPASSESREQYEAVVGSFPIDKITGSSSRIISLARYCDDRGITLRPRAVVASHEHMPESGRRLVEAVFACSVTMLYMTSETGPSAWECPRHRMHFQDDFVVPEMIARDGQDGSDIVLTDLSSTVMPIIRYVSGDMSTGVTECDCGLPGTVVDGFIGRARVSLLGRDGELYSPYTLLGALAESRITDFQLVQEEEGVVQLIVPADDGSCGAVARVLNDALDESLGARRGFRLVARPDEPFVLTAAGKRNPVVQRLDLPLGPERQGYILPEFMYIPARAAHVSGGVGH